MFVKGLYAVRFRDTLQIVFLLFVLMELEVILYLYSLLYTVCWSKL